MGVDINQTLAGVQTLNRPGQRFTYSVEGTSIVGRWLWQDQTLFAPTAVNEQVREFLFIVDLGTDGTYAERTKEHSESSSMGIRKDGSLGMSMSKSAFSGNSSRKSFSFSIGKDNQTGEVGVVTASLDSDEIKKPLRDYLESLGWKRKGGFFSRLFGG